MNVPKAAPGEGPKKDRDHFPHWSIGAGERHFAYIAGPTAWVIAHTSDRGTKPCLDWMTAGELPCRFCRTGKEPARVGYVPLYRAVDWKPLLVIVYDEEQEWINQCRTHDRVQLGREKEKGARLWVRKCALQEPKYATTVARRQSDQDVDDSMLTLWKMPELVAWLQCRRVSDNAVSLALCATPASAPEPADDGRTVEVTRECLDGDESAADRGARNRAFVSRLKGGVGPKPSANGKRDG